MTSRSKRIISGAAGAPAPPRVSKEEALRALGPDAVYYATRLRGASNKKARRALEFRPRPLEWISRLTRGPVRAGLVRQTAGQEARQTSHLFLDPDRNLELIMKAGIIYKNEIAPPAHSVRHGEFAHQIDRAGVCRTDVA